MACLFRGCFIFIPWTLATLHIHPTFHVDMLSVLRREACRLPGIRALIPQAIKSVVEFPQPSRKSRLFSTSSLVHGGDERHQLTETLAVLGGWHAAGSREPWLWRREGQREGVFSSKMSEMLGGKRFLGSGYVCCSPTSYREPSTPCA